MSAQMRPDSSVSPQWKESKDISPRDDRSKAFGGMCESNDISGCLQRVKAAEEALAHVREALMKINNASMAPSYSAARQTAPHQTAPRPPDLISLPVMALPSVSLQVQEVPSRSPPRSPIGITPSNALAVGTHASQTFVIGQKSSLAHSVSRKSFMDLHLEHSETHERQFDRLGGIDAVSQKYGISREDTEKCFRAFSGCDVDGTGLVNATELNVLMEEACGMRFSHHEIDQILKKYDKDRDGVLSMEEFFQLYCETPLHKSKDLDNHITRVGQEIRQQMEDERMTPHERVDGLGVSAKALTSYLRKEINEAGACIQLPVAAMLLIFFALSVFWHMRTEELHAVDTAITWDVYQNANFAWSGEVPFENGRMGHKNLEDVNSFADFWSWFNLGIVPIFWPEGWDVSEVRLNMGTRCMNVAEAFGSMGFNSTLTAGLPNNSSWIGTCAEILDPPTPRRERWGAEANVSHYLYFYTILGGMRLQQESTKAQPCPAPDKELQSSVRSSICLGDLGYWLEPELRQALWDKSEYIGHEGAETEYLLSREPQSKVREVLRDLENKAWLNPRTAKVELMFTTYNAHMDLLTATYIFFFLNRGGHIHKIVEPVSIWLHPYHGWWNYVVDFLWCFLVLCIMITEMLEVGKHLRQLGLVRGIQVYMRLGNAVDWCNILYSIVLVVFWLRHLDELSSIRSLIRRGDAAVVGTWTDNQDRQQFFSEVSTLMGNHHTFRLLLSWYPFVLISRLFKAFAHQPRLGLVTRTMSEASTDIIHFAVVFGSIFVIYATSAMILFGQEILYFANFGRSLSTIFRILLGEFDWEDLQRVGRLRANLWFWSFMWLVHLTMLNMLLAIVMDIYTEVKGGMGSDAETMWSQVYEIYNRTREVHAGRQVRLEEILCKVDPTDLDEFDDEEDGVLALEFYTTKSLCEAIPALKEDQAKYILVEAQKRFEEQQRTSTSLTDTALTVQKMAGMLWKLHAAVQELFHISEMSAQLSLVATEAAGHMAVCENTTPAAVEEKEDTEPKHVANREMTSSIEALSSILDDFRQQHRDTHDMIKNHREFLAACNARASAFRPWEVPEMKQPQVVAPRPLFHGICSSPRIHKRDEALGQA